MKKKSIICAVSFFAIGIIVVAESCYWSACHNDLRYDVEIKMVLTDPPFSEFKLRNDEVNKFMEAYEHLGNPEKELKDDEDILEGIYTEFYITGKDGQHLLIFCDNYVSIDNQRYVFREDEPLVKVAQNIWESKRKNEKS